MKAVLMSVQPKWCGLIADEKKTIEIRKNFPKLKTPFKCYIYETKNTNGVSGFTILGKYRLGKVIGEFVCNDISQYNYHRNLPKFNGLLGLPTGVYDSYLIFQTDYKDMCLSYNQVKDYGKGKTLYGWHISDLKIYDKPKELSEFYSKVNCDYENSGYCKICTDNCKYKNGNFYHALTRPPQSWCYVED